MFDLLEIAIQTIMLSENCLPAGLFVENVNTDILLYVIGVGKL